jgi:hypothetical protein
LWWPYGVNGRDYPQMKYDDKMQNVCHIVCEIVHGPAPTPDHEAAHSCGNGAKGCVSPRHVRWRTDAQNRAEKVEHGGTKSYRGTKHPLNRLTEDQVCDIREELAEQERMRKKIGRSLQRLSCQAIARRFDVSSSTVHMIRDGKTWDWLRTDRDRRAKEQWGNVRDHVDPDIYRTMCLRSFGSWAPGVEVVHVLTAVEDVYHDMCALPISWFFPAKLA